MLSVNPFKPLISTLLAVVWLASFTFIDPGPQGFLQSVFYFDPVGASTVKWTAVVFIGVLWLLTQIFLVAPPESSRLSLVLSGSILWLGLLLFFNFETPSYGGAVAFFALIGGLGVVVMWTRYLADEF